MWAFWSSLSMASGVVKRSNRMGIRLFVSPSFFFFFYFLGAKEQTFPSVEMTYLHTAKWGR
uniref:Uncharacterized protein n=1 Tax=Anguilla anguilla TaxID=7936 RepID=A0A0E9SYJ4_ANGAN